MPTSQRWDRNHSSIALTWLTSKMAVTSESFKWWKMEGGLRNVFYDIHPNYKGNSNRDWYTIFMNYEWCVFFLTLWILWHFPCGFQKTLSRYSFRWWTNPAGYGKIHQSKIVWCFYNKPMFSICGIFTYIWAMNNCVILRLNVSFLFDTCSAREIS